MRPALIFRQYTWLVNQLMEHGPMTLRELNDHWVADEMADGNPLSRSTFNRHRDAILSMFGVIIDCCPALGYRYRISNPEVLSDGTMERWLIAQLTVGNVLADSVQVKDRILLENVPSCEIFLSPVIIAIRKGRLMRVQYRRFGDNREHNLRLAPYALKFFNRRWYLLARGEHHIATFSLDRFVSVEVTDEPFEMPDDFSPADYFADYYGVLTLADVPREHVVLRAWGVQARYMQTLPLHPSQRVVAEGDGYTDFALDIIRPTPDFLKALVAEGDKLQVLEPESLRQQMLTYLQGVIKVYQQEKIVIT